MGLKKIKARSIANLRSEGGERVARLERSQATKSQQQEVLTPTESLATLEQRIRNLDPNNDYDAHPEIGPRVGLCRSRWIHQDVSTTANERLSVKVSAVYHANERNSYGLGDLVEVNAIWSLNGLHLGTEVVNASQAREVSLRQEQGLGTYGAREMHDELIRLTETLDLIESQSHAQAA